MDLSPISIFIGLEAPYITPQILSSPVSLQLIRTMQAHTLLTVLVLLAAAEAAPAPQVVTVYQTLTQVTNTDGSIYTTVPAAAAAAPATPTTAAAVAAAAPSPAATLALGFNLGNTLKSLFLKLEGGSSNAATTNNAAAPASTAAAAPSAAPASGGFNLSLLGNSLKSFLLKLEGGNAAAPSTNTATTASAGIPAVPTLFSSVPVPAYTPPTSLAASTSTSSSPAPAASGDLYAEIAEGDDIDTQFAKDTLDIHNQYRADHGVAALSWSNDAYNYAKNNADNYDCLGVLTHTHGPYGENLAAGFPDGPLAVTAWYDEGLSYSYLAANTYDHFTQVVWKGLTLVGCAYKDCSAEGWQKYVVCEYDPPGNVIGYNLANVLPPTN